MNILCSHTREVPIEDLKPHPRNPNKHPEDQVDLLSRLIEHHGWRTPITVSKRSGFIVRGHARWEAAKKLRLKKVPVDEQHYDSEEDEIADLIADNKIQELSELDEDQVKVNMIYLHAQGYGDLTMTGYLQEEVADLMVEGEPPKLSGSGGETREPEDKLVHCPKCGFTWDPETEG